MAKLNRLIVATLLVAVPALLIILLVHQPPSVQANRLGARKAEGIIKWKSYMQLFNKRYSSPVQMIARQTVFMANAMNVFMTAVKYKLFLLSYYTTINKFSDMTNEEGERMLNGDIETHDEPMSDEEVGKQLLELLGEEHPNPQQIEQEIELERRAALAKSNRRRRRKRSADGAEFDEPQAKRELSLSDLTRPADDKWPDDEQNLKIKWVVPSNNDNYEPHEVFSYGATSPKTVDVVEDIPIEQLERIKEEGSSTPSGVQSVAGAAKSALRVALDWLSPDPVKDEESQFGSGDVEIDDFSETEPEDVIVLNDWRQSGCIGPVRTQGHCSCCYAMAIMGQLEWELCKHQTYALTPLSVQYMVSCGPQFSMERPGQVNLKPEEVDPKLEEVNLQGCNRGATHRAMEFIEEYGMELEVHMPFLKEDSQCPIDMETPRKKKGYIRPNVRKQLTLNAKTDKLDLALKAGPLVMVMRYPDGMLNFGGGMVEQCKKNGRHSVILVGNAIEDGVEYLIVKNSFGVDWGDKGYFKLKRSAVIGCVRRFLRPRVSFPSNRSQTRRMKAYLADRSSLPQVEPSLEKFFE